MKKVVQIKFKRVQALAIVGVIAFSSLALASCGENSASSSENLAAEQILNLIEDEPTTLDVDDLRNTNEAQIVGHLQEPLYRSFIKDGSEVLEPAAAVSFELSNGDKTATFKLRDNLWSDQKPVTAGQFVDSVIRNLNPDSAWATADQLTFIAGAKKYNEEGGSADDVLVKALDDKTLEITTEAPLYDVPNQLGALYPIRLDIVEKAGGDKAYATALQDGPENYVSSGPFVGEEWISGESIKLAKNDSYWDAENVHITTVNYQLVDQPETIQTLFESGQVDVVNSTGAKVGDYRQTAQSIGATEYLSKPNGTSFLVLNQKEGGLSGVLASPKVREALVLAIDRDEYNDVISNGLAYPATDLVTPDAGIGDRQYREWAGSILDDLIAQYGHDYAKIQDLFKEGLRDLGKSDDLSEVTLVFNATESSATDKARDDYLKQVLEKNLGIKIDVQVAPDSTSYKTRRNSNQFDISQNGWYAGKDPSGALELWKSSYGFSKFFGFYNSKQYDTYFAELEKTADVDKRFELYKKLEEQILTVDFGVVPLTHPNEYYYVSNKVKGISVLSFGISYDYSRSYKVD